MIDKIQVKWFKSIENVEIEPGCVNVLIGANGSGKSNFLEAIGVISAAVSGRVDDEALKYRGVRPGVPALYKCSFPNLQSNHIYFGAWSSFISYEVTLFNPIKDPSPAWRYHTEALKKHGTTLWGRSNRDAKKYNPEAGLIASKMVEMKESDILRFLNELRDFAIYTPDTPTLRGIIPDSFQRQPLGLSGGQLANELSVILNQRLSLKSMTRVSTTEKLKSDNTKQSENVLTYLNKVLRDALGMIDWAKSYGTTIPSSIPLSPSVSSVEKVIRFKDRFMKSERDILSGYDASEGALYILFHAVLAAHPKSPLICAVDNADHSLNPRLARELLRNISDWYLNSPYSRQIFLTTQNPYSLDGLPLQNDKVRLFTVSRTEKGRTILNRIILDEKHREMAAKGWTLSRLWVMGHLGGVPNV